MTKTLSWSAIAAGFVTVLVGFTSSAVIVFQATEAAGAAAAQVSSWIGAVGLTCIGLLLRYRAPVATSRSTPRAELLVTSLAGVPMVLFCFRPALITFLATASGISLFGLRAAFWGLVAGALALVALNWQRGKTSGDRPKTRPR